VKVNIKNFQSIKDIELEINGFTVLVGRNNIGKSAIRRAIGGALANAPGQTFVREGTDEARVELKTDNLHLIWKKGKKANSYEVDGKKYKRVGRGSPVEVSDAGFKPVTLSSGEKLNPQFADAHAPIFLLDKSGLIVAELISSVSRLSVINSANRLCDKDLRDLRSTQKVREADLKLVGQRLERLVGLSDLVLLNRETQDQWKKIESLTSDVKDLDRFYHNLLELKEIIDVFETVLELDYPEDNFSDPLEELKEMGRFIEELTQFKQQVTLLTPLTLLEIPDPSFEQMSEFTQIIEWVEKMESLNTDIQHFADVDEIELPTIDEMLAAELENLNKLVELYETLSCEVENLNSLSETKKSDLDDLEKRLHDEVGELDLCPLCNSEIVN